ncbi:MAG: PhpK family radical SAM P-methyltransferase [Candidatus Aminicenantes bacterium]|nr:MAG: PhpK family radical SAM P-methyltransferase [Candidatus Aminicenantes bacterium]
MNKAIDCFLIGHNEMDFREYEKTVKKMGIHSGAYRDLALNFIEYNNHPYTISEVFNLFCSDAANSKASAKPLRMGETFSASIAYLVSYLSRRGFTYDYVNSFRDEKRVLAKKLAENDVLAVAITTTFYVAVFPILEIVNFIKKYNPYTKIIIGGPFVATQVQILDDGELHYLFKSIGADFYVNSSQGETTLEKIIHHLKNKQPVDQINNIYYKTDNGYVSTPIVKENNRLADNMVNWDLLADGLGEYVNVRTAVSCPFSCAFCGFPQHAGKYQIAPVEAIENELDQLDKPGTVKCVHFIDDTFNVPLKRYKDILRMIIKNKYKFQWHSYFRCQFADRETVELMKESGCEGVYLGLESGNDQILKNMNKGTKTGEYLKGIALLKEYEIVTFSSFVIGFPGETHETVQDTIRLIENSGLDFYRAQLWYCDPITPIWREREKYQLEGERFEWSHATMDSPTACDLIEDIFLSIKKSTWIPQYNFDFDNFWHLVHRGMNPEQVKGFLKSFNNGIREKILNPSPTEASFEIIKQIVKSCQAARPTDDIFNNKNNLIEKYDVEFKF